jgi:hypothetical protein
MDSIVRAAIGAEFTGGTYEESFVLADVRMNWSHGRDDVQLFFSPAGLVVMAPLPGGTVRIVATLDDAREHPAAADIQALIDARGPTGGTADVTRVVWSSRFRIHHRLAREIGSSSAAMSSRKESGLPVRRLRLDTPTDARFSSGEHPGRDQRVLGVPFGPWTRFT